MVCEKALGYGMAIANGATSFGVGCLAFSDVGSPVQLVIDCELARFAADLYRDISTDDDHLGLDSIDETIPAGGKYLESIHTAQFFREESWLPALFDYRAFMAWAKAPGDMIAAATGKARELYSTAANHCPLDDDRKRELQKLLKDADAALGRG
jgi:trimethylamine:corrinoid methyltransferase-like protein